MSNSYERGYQQGKWDKTTLQQTEWESAEACLKHLESLYGEEIRSLQDVPLEGHREYIEGKLQAARDSLQPIIEYETGSKRERE